jgi:crotonobetainyl-CoA:carnitine CoA-transferase CaiB-like acyl-CoA transferase
VTIAVGSETEWRALCQVTGHPEWQGDARFADAYSRVCHQQALDTLLTAWTQHYTPEEVTARLQQTGVAAFPSMDSAMLATSEHLQARGAYITVTHPKLGSQTVLGPPWRSPGVPHQPDRPAPLLGEHTAAVLRALLGLEETEIRRLADAGVLD